MKTCEASDCDNLIDQDRRSDSIYCSSACKRRAMRARKKERKTSNFLLSFGTGSESRGSESAISETSRAAGDRFRAMVARDEALRVPQHQEREWAEYTRRHNTIHPDEQAARIARGLQARADDWDQGTARFVKPVSTIAEQARRARSQQRRPTKPAQVSGPTSWDDDDPELEAEMITGDIYRSGYRHAEHYR
jgi:hypothetical protein